MASNMIAECCGIKNNTSTSTKKETDNINLMAPVNK